MTGIRHQIAISASPAEVYAMLSSPEAIGTWWDKQTLVHADEGDVLEHNPGEEHGVVRLKIVDQQPHRRIEWECISSHRRSSPASAWTGTHFIFEISDQDTPASIIERACANHPLGEMTSLNFSQTHYDEASPFYAFNNHAWGHVLQSLKQACESSPPAA